jgi:4'-phosphopantetheinyl transferase EntD
VASRRREFAAGRVCARNLLARIGIEPVAILSACDRSPLWPSGAIGSISHDRKFCAVAVARADRVSAIGIDIEPDEPLEEDLWPQLFLAAELERLASCSRHTRGNVARVLFSAKECVYKGTRALVRATLGFQDVEIVLAPGGDRFRALVHHPAGAAVANVVLEGIHFVCAGSIQTGMTLRGARHDPVRGDARS